MARTKGKGPLNDLRVIEFDGLGPTPFSAMQLADMGAKVIRISRKSGTQTANQYTDVKDVQKASDNPLNIKMWKGYDGVEREYEKEYLDHWTCEICNDHTHEVDYDYLGSGTNHLSCELKEEELQEKSDKIMEQLEIDFKDYDLSNAESNENSKVDMSATAKRGKK